MIKKLMILGEDDEYDYFHYRISCQCTEPNCCVDLDIDGLSIEFWRSYQNFWRTFWQRLKTGLLIIFTRRRWMTDCFVFDEDNVEAFEYVLQKWKEVRAKKYAQPDKTTDS